MSGAEEHVLILVHLHFIHNIFPSYHRHDRGCQLQPMISSRPCSVSSLPPCLNPSSTISAPLCLSSRGNLVTRGLIHLSRPSANSPSILKRSKYDLYRFHRAVGWADRRCGWWPPDPRRLVFQGGRRAQRLKGADKSQSRCPCGHPFQIQARSRWGRSFCPHVQDRTCLRLSRVGDGSDHYGAPPPTCSSNKLTAIPCTARPDCM
jgi:hypothetical protein